MTATLFAASPQRRTGRTLFAMYVCAIYVSLMIALPLVHAFAQTQPLLSQQAEYPTFEQLDRNGDRGIDSPEARAVPGLFATFERADANRDGRLDRAEYARALALLDGHR